MKVHGMSDNHAQWIEDLIKEFVSSSENTLENAGQNRIWNQPLIGFSRGDDPLFQRLKDDIGPFLWTPMEIFALTFATRLRPLSN